MQNDGFVLYLVSQASKQGENFASNEKKRAWNAEDDGAIGAMCIVRLAQKARRKKKDDKHSI